MTCETVNFNIISTGSKGNAVLLSDCMLIDCGVSFKALQAHFRGLKLVLLTHCHGDHFCKSTVRKLALERPSLRFGCCEWLVKELVECGVSKANIDVYLPEIEYVYGLFTIMPFSLVHNVPNCGYKVQFADGFKALYATDTNEIKHVEAKGYNLYLLEANHTQADIAQRIRDKQENGKFCYEYDVIENHLSKEKADNWLYENMNMSSQYVYLHGHEE